MRQQRNSHRGRLWPVRHHHILGQRRKRGILEPFDRFAKLPLAAVLLDFGILELAIVLRQNARNRAVFAQKRPELGEETCVNGTLNPRRSIPRTPTQASLLGIASGLTVRRHRPSKRREAQKPTNSCGSADSLSVRPFQVPTSPLLHLRRARREAKGQNLFDTVFIDTVDQVRSYS